VQGELLCRDLAEVEGVAEGREVREVEEREEGQGTGLNLLKKVNQA